MCLILFAKNVHPEYPLIVAANRDEFYNRPTQSAAFWSDHTYVLAGKDLEGGGTWMGMTKGGRLSMLTNYRDLSTIKSDAPSRGHLVADFLLSDTEPDQYLAHVAERGTEYNGFNLLVGNIDRLHYYSNYQAGVHRVGDGIHGLSNALLNTNWPKVDAGKRELSALLSTTKVEHEALFELLYDDDQAPDHTLPDTGVGMEMERMLSPKFIKSHHYGSRCSTVILVHRGGEINFVERTYNTHDFEFTTKRFVWSV